MTVGSGEQANNAFSQQLDDFLGTQMQIIKSADVEQRASDYLKAQYPDMPESKVKLEIKQTASVLTLNATGPNKEYTQRWLDAIVRGYQQKKSDMRRQTTDQALEKVREETARVETILKADDEDMIKFQRDHNVVFDKGENAGQSDLLALQNKLSSLQSDYDKLSLMTPDQNLGASGGDARARAGLENSTAEDAYRQAQQLLVKYKSDLEDLSHDLRPKHPKIIALKQHRRPEEAHRRSAQAEPHTHPQPARTRRLDDQDDQGSDRRRRTEGAQSNALLKMEFDKLAEPRKRATSKTNADLQNAVNKAA